MNRATKRILAFTMAVMLVVSGLFSGEVNVKAADNYTWGPIDFTNAVLLGENEYVGSTSGSQYGIQIADKSSSTMTVSGGALYITAASDKYKAINIQTGENLGGTSYYAANGFSPTAGKEYKVTFDATVASGTGQVRVRGNSALNENNWQATNLTADNVTKVEYTYKQAASGGNLQIETGSTATGIALIVDNLMIEEIIAAEPTRTVIYDMQNELSGKNSGDKITGTTVLSQSGSPTITVTDNTAGKKLVLSDRTETHFAVDIKLKELKLNSGCEYEFAITGKTSNAGTVVVLAQTNKDWGWKHNVTSDSSGGFLLTKSFTYADLKSEVDAGQNFRIQANDTNGFEIYDIIITEIGDASGGAAVAPTPIPSYYGSTIFYDLNADLAGSSDGASYTLPAIIGKSENPSVTVKDYKGGKSILLDDRESDKDWSGLDIKSDQMKVDGKFVEGKYTISITGHVAENVEIPANAKIKIAMGASPWTTLKGQAVSDTDRSFTLNYEVDLTAGLISSLGYNFRIQTENAPTLPFYIDSLRVMVQEPVKLEFNFGPEDQENYKDWWKPGSSMELTWDNSFGNGDNYSLKAARISTGYGASASGIQVVFPEKLPPGQYYISADFFAPEEGNVNKTLDEESILVNNTGGSSKHRFPAGAAEDDNGGTLEAWVTVDGTTSEELREAISELRFRYFGNQVQRVPDVFYLDNVTIELVGSVEIEVWPDPEWDMELPSIKDKYSSYFLLGNIMEPGNLNDGYGTTEMFLHHYNVITAENAMKPNQLSSVKGDYNFDRADSVVKWAADNSIKVHGHTLVWHSQSPAWLNTGEAENRTAARANMEEYITKVAGHYKDQLISWDVVNEAFENSGTGFDGKDWRSALRKDSPWYLAYEKGADKAAGESGADYIYEAFVLTRQIDPLAELYYNDYNEEIPNKRDAIALMVEDLNNKWKNDEKYDGRLLIEGIGMQSHYWMASFDSSVTEAAIKRFAATGARISISELDIPAGAWNIQHSGKKLTAEQEKEQAVYYAELFTIYKKYASSIDRVTIWGKADGQSWRAFGMPVLFDNSFYAKEAYYAVMNPESYVTSTPGGSSSGDSGNSGTPAASVPVPTPAPASNTNIIIEKNEDGSRNVIVTPEISVIVPKEGSDSAGNAGLLITVPDINLMDKAEDGKVYNVTIEIPEKYINEFINALDNNILSIALNIVIPKSITNDDSMAVNKIIIPESVYQTALKKDKELVINVLSEDGTGYSWAFDSKLLNQSGREMVPVNALIDIAPLELSKDSILKDNIKKDNNNVWKDKVRGMLLSFRHDGLLPASAKVKVYAASNPAMSGIKKGSTLYLYHVNPETNVLEQLPTMKYVVDKDGYVTIDITHCSDYVLLPKAVNAASSEDLFKQINVKLSADKMYAAVIAGTEKAVVDNEAKVLTDLPSTLRQVDKFSETVTDAAVAEVKVSYQSSDKKIVSVSQNGVVKALKKGNAVISVTVEFGDGMKKVYTCNVTVDNPSIKFTKSPSTIALGGKETFEIAVKGYKLSDVTWMTEKKDKAVVSKHRGKLYAVLSGKTAGTDVAAVYVNGVKAAEVKVKVVK